jgi:transketolase C-terminal domain/subunit
MDGGTHCTGSVRAVVSFLNDKEDFVHGQAFSLKSGSDIALLITHQSFSSALAVTAVPLQHDPWLALLL